MVVHTAIGKRTRRADAAEKLTGELRFAGDLTFPGMVHARLVVSPYAHARIRSIDKSAAEKLPGVVAVLTAPDLHLAGTGGSRATEPLAQHEVLFNGHPVAAVIAESEAIAEDALALVSVEYDVLPVVLDPLESMRPTSPRVREGKAGENEDMGAHGSAGGGVQDDNAPLPPNVSNRIHYKRGDLDRGFAEADEVVEQTYHTQWVHQGYIEPQSAVAALDQFGTLTIWSATQAIFTVRREVSKILGLPTHRLKIVSMPVGGGFGAKFGLVESLAGSFAMVVKRPVQLVFTRMEEFSSSNPAPQAILEIKIGAKKDGSVTALQARVTYDCGAYPGAPLGICCLLMSAYRWPNADVLGYEVSTHRTSPGAYRGPGAVQSFFAIESTLDELSRRLKIDPLELRIKNASREGDPQLNGQPFPRIGLTEVLERVREHPLWKNRDQKGPNEGIGVAVGGWNGGLEPAAAACRLDHDGTFTIVTGSVDLNGTNTGFAMIAAEVLGIPVEQVRVINPDTDSAPFSGGSGGSKITLTVGAAVKKAAEQAKEQILATAADMLEAAPQDVELINGMIRVKGVPDRSLSMGDVSREIYRFGGRYEPVDGKGATAVKKPSPGFAVHIARVHVDPESGRVQVKEYVAAQDVGFAINPATVEGQIMGGVSQGIGWALMEKLVHSEDGQLLTGSLMDYALPSTLDVPPIEVVLVEVPSPDGPFGAKGVGEPPVVPVPATIANAIYDATGVRMTDLPIQSEPLFRAMHRK